MKNIVNKGFVIVVFSTMLCSLAEGVDFGIKAGLNIANMNVEGLQSRIGFCGGGFATIGVGDIVVIQPEAMYTQKGAKWESWYGPPGIITLKLDYVDIPLLFKFMLPVKGVVKPNLFVGPYFAINVNAKRKIEGHVTSEERNYGPYAEAAALGIVLGGGVDFSLKKGKIVFDGRYTLELTTTAEEPFDQKNEVFSFMLGYSF